MYYTKGPMKDFSLFLIAFGGIVGFAGWFLYQKSLARFIQQIKSSHHSLWVKLGSPDENIAAYHSLLNTNLRQYITQQHYKTCDDLFVNNQGNLIRQRLLFILFCLVCLVIGIVLYILS